MKILGLTITRAKPNNKNKAKTRGNRPSASPHARNKQMKSREEKISESMKGNRNAEGHGAPKDNKNAQKYFPLEYDGIEHIGDDKKKLNKFLVFVVQQVIERKIDPRAASSVNGLVENILYCVTDNYVEEKLHEMEIEAERTRKALENKLDDKRKLAIKAKTQRSNNNRSSGMD